MSMNPLARIPEGATASRAVTVTRDLTVAHFNDGMPEVYGTPMMIYLMEVASAAAIEEFLPEGWVSVGVAVDVRHLAGTPIGFKVTATARVVSVDEKTVCFEVEAHDGAETVGKGRHVRAPVELARFEKGMRTKAEVGFAPDTPS